MSKQTIFDDPTDHSNLNLEEEGVAADLVLEELRRILASRHFKTSRRGKEFLQYVVEQKIHGNGHLLKERLIGAQIFGRKPDYGTGEDPVVRVQAGDVRRRLESYNADPDSNSEVAIQIPVGSYAPVFLARKSTPPSGRGEDVAQTAVSSMEGSGVVASHSSVDGDSDELDHQLAQTELSSSSPRSETDLPRSVPLSGRAGAFSNLRDRKAGIAVLILICVALLAYLAIAHIRKSSPDGTLKAFWLPAAVSAKPVLICLPRPIVYRPSEKLYDDFANAHPKSFATREARRDQILPLAPTDTIRWGDMTPVRNSGPGIGAVVAAVNIGKLLAEQGIRFELRFGDEATYAEMRDSPVVLVGAINTEWATELTAESAFVFDETVKSPNIHETAGAKRVWKMESNEGNITRDFGLITRQASGKTGQFLVQVAGISHFGTQAASEFLANKKEFAAALHAQSISLQEKNLQVVVSTDVTAGRAGPPHIVAISRW